MDKIKFNKTLKFLVKEKCLKRKQVIGDKGKCCCNCMFQIKICGHPWVTGTSIKTPTGLFACGAMMFMDDGNPKDKRSVMASDGHGLCEMWEKFDPTCKLIFTHYKQPTLVP